MADHNNPDGIIFTKHSLERSHFCDGRRCSRWYLIDQHGDKHLAVIGTENHRRDGHYKYIAVSNPVAVASKEPLASSKGLNCSNQSGVYKWLDSMIKHHAGDSDHAAQSTGHPKPQQQQQHSAGSTQHSQPGPLHDGAINQERQQAQPNYHHQQQQQAQQQQAQQQQAQQQQAQQPAEHCSIEAMFESIATAPLPPSSQKRSQADLQEHSAARDSPATAATQPNASSFINEHSKRRRKQVHPLRIAAAYLPCGHDSVAAVGTGSRAAAEAAAAAAAGVEKCKSGKKLRREYSGSAAAEQHQQQQKIAEQQQQKKQNSYASRTISLNDDLSRHIRRGSCMGVMGRAQWDLFRQQHKDEIALARQQRLEARQQQRLEQQLEKEEKEHSQQHGVLQLVFSETTAADAGEPSAQQQEQQQQHQDNILDVQAQRLTHADRPPGKDNATGVSLHRAHQQQQQQQQPIPGGHQPDTVLGAAPIAAAAGLDTADAGAVSASPTTGQQKLADHTAVRHCAVDQYAAAPAAQVADESQGKQPSRLSPAAKPPAAARLPLAAGGAGGDLVALPPPAAAAAAAAEVPPPAVTAEVPTPAAASASAGSGQDENLVRLTAVISMLNALLEHLKPGLDGSTHRDFLKHMRHTAVTLQLTPTPKKPGQLTAEVAQQRQMWLLLYEPHVKSYYDDMKQPERQDEAWMRDVCDMLGDVLINR